MTFVCIPCKNQLHDKCDGITKSRTWCDCHHKIKEKK